MAYEIEIREAKAQPVLSIRITTTMAEMSSLLGALFGETFACAGSLGATPCGPPFARYHTWGGAEIELEAGVPVLQPVEGKGRVLAGELPGGRLAATWHIGPYDTIGGAYGALERWMGAQGLEPAGAPWEVYWSDPQEVPDPSQWKTEVIWPIK